MRLSCHQPSRTALGVLIAAAIQACDYSATYAGGNQGFAMSLGAATMALAPGGAASTFLEVTRTGGLTSDITYTVTGAPAGLEAHVVNTTVRDSSTLTVTASPTVAAAAYSLVVNATAPGAVAQQATLVVTVSPAAGADPAITLVTAGAHTCALSTVGAAYCWGSNANGELGSNASSMDNPTPVTVAGSLTFQRLSLSKVEGVSCGLTAGGGAYCWGDNAEGQLGDGTTARRLTPTPVAGGLTFRSLAVGNEHVCGIATNGTAWCWGSTPNGAFGDGTVGTHLTPAATAPGMTFESIVAGSDYTCALTPAGAAWCWGLGVNGQLGNGSSAMSTTPMAVSGGLTFRALAAGGQTACGLTADGKAYCWGYNFFGTVGDGTSGTGGGTSRRLVPIAVTGGLIFESLAAGHQTMCALTAAGAAYCWGYNFGAVGDGTADHRSSPVAVAGGLTFRGISSGSGYSCGVTTTSAVYCWGDNSNGELGDGTIATRLTPTPVRWP
jgi:alpha-tubulin suppressor-like RCC1 family protein